ncbi:TetR/AcrR family transcriptional regulator [Neobacillus niacini]|uniref:TetR/AcrR family transcriptional regulator n=1 Tax=Neobacillus niacini TaxID=86668 RepID=UPI0021CB9972|nr:TetR/AcrR family transcriptional regulator [Neobacillus niacini]MCM3765563.1 TetR/AcrR family transcriptional regulator [Neobacillus niacini]
MSDDYKKNKKALILKSAFECFAEKGFQVATMEDIVKHSNISKGAIYNYFSSKDEIYIELMNERTSESINKLRDELGRLKTSNEKLEHLFNVYSDVNKTSDYVNATRVHIEFWLYSTRKDDLRTIMISRFNMYKDLFKTIIDEGIKNGEFSKKANSEELSLIFWGVIDGSSLHHAMLLELFPFQNVITELKQIIYLKLKEK